MKARRFRWTQFPIGRRCGACSTARLSAITPSSNKSDEDYRVIGDPTEGALVCLAEKAGLRGMHQRLHLNPFESIRKRMSVVVKPYRQEDATIYVKGAPLEMLQQCDRIDWSDEVRAADGLGSRAEYLKKMTPWPSAACACSPLPTATAPN